MYIKRATGPKKYKSHDGNREADAWLLEGKLVVCALSNRQLSVVLLFALKNVEEHQVET